MDPDAAAQLRTHPGPVPGAILRNSRSIEKATILVDHFNRPF